MRWLRDFGAWVAIAGILATGLVGWGKVTTQVDSHEARLGKVEPAVQQTQTDSAVLKEALDDIRRTVHELRDREK
jgi:hypothetical protein